MLLRYPSQLALLLATILPSISAEASERWIFPSVDSNPIYNYLDIVNASWTSTYNPPTLILWCHNATAGAADKRLYPQYNQTVPQTGSRLIPLNYDAAALACHFEVLSAKAIRSGKRSVPTFNSSVITVEVVRGKQPVTWSQNDAAQAPTTSGTATASQTEITVVPSKTSNATAATSSASQEGLSTATRAGIGVSAAVGVLVIISSVAALLWLGRRKRRILDRCTRPHEKAIDMSGELQANDPPQEMEANPRQELPTTPVVRELSHHDQTQDQK